jgi:hypothetical protein
MTILNLKHRNIFGYHILVWWNTKLEFKLVKIDNRMYKKYSLYIGRLIFEIGSLKYGKSNKPVRTANK